uniref:Uncharacterized protein n=1 Tax=Anguilla anguilla TaxID=7936 RepID=A0A0E9V8I5_ANGAN
MMSWNRSHVLLQMGTDSLNVYAAIHSPKSGSD